MFGNQWSYIILVPDVGRPKTIEEWLRMELLHFFDDQYVKFDVWCHSKLALKTRVSNLFSNIHYLFKLFLHKKAVVFIDDELLKHVQFALLVLKVLKGHRFVLVFRNHEQGCIKIPWLNKYMKKWLFRNIDMYLVDSKKAEEILWNKHIQDAKIKFFQPDPELVYEFRNQSHEQLMIFKQNHSISRYTRQQKYNVLEHVV